MRRRLWLWLPIRPTPLREAGVRVTLGLAGRAVVEVEADDGLELKVGPETSLPPSTAAGCQTGCQTDPNPLGCRQHGALF